MLLLTANAKTAIVATVPLIIVALYFAGAVLLTIVQAISNVVHVPAGL